MRTPQDFRREDIKQLFDKILKSHQIKLNPFSISAEESFESDFTRVELSINETKQGVSGPSFILSESEAKGFVDGMFKSCHNHYVENYPSLSNIRLVNYQVKPKIKRSESKMGTDAESKVTIMVDVKGHGVADFSCTSRSILHSTFIATLGVFEFYINCEETFKKLKLFLEDANNRNREDVAQGIISDMAKLTTVNTYA